MSLVFVFISTFNLFIFPQTLEVIFNVGVGSVWKSKGFFWYKNILKIEA